MTRDKLKAKLQRALRRDLWLTLAPILLIVGLAFAAAAYFIKPAPPKKIVLATGPDEGGSKYFARKYKEVLAKNGVELEVRETTGSVENAKLLTDPGSGVEVAFMMGGTQPPDGTDGIVSLGALAYSPIWIFYKGTPVSDLWEFRGKKIAIGPPDSSTHWIARQLLKANQVDGEPTELQTLGRADAMKALEEGKVDVIFVSSPAESPAIQKFAATPGILLLDMVRAEAYSRRYTFLTRLTLPRGVLDLANDVPPENAWVISPTMNLVARDSLHPALAFLLMRAASDIHHRAGLLAKSGEFPSGRETGFPLSDQARRFYTSGVPLLQRYLPFWAANLVDRLWVMLVPIIAVLLPLFRLVPPLYRWRVRSRIYRWYARLKDIELQLEAEPETAKLDELLKKLDTIETAVNRIPTPLAYSDNLYGFRAHLDLVRQRIAHKLANGQPRISIPEPAPTAASTRVNP